MTPTFEPWMASLPENVVSVERKGELILGLDEQGNPVMEFILENEEWVEVEQEPNSCVAPEVIAQQDADFTARMGIVLDNPTDERSVQFANKVNGFTSVGFHDQVKDSLTMQFVKTGVGTMSAKEATGGKIDSIVCIYGRNGVIPNETISVVVGWIDPQGNYHQMTRGFDFVTGMDLSQPWPLREKPTFLDNRQQLEALQNMPDGAVLQFFVHSFAGVETVDQVRSEQETNTQNTEAAQEFVRLMDKGMLERFGAENSITAYWQALEPAKGDAGFIPSGSWEWYDLLWTTSQP
jgi:hypothetical protein